MKEKRNRIVCLSDSSCCRQLVTDRRSLGSATVQVDHTEIIGRGPGTNFGGFLCLLTWTWLHDVWSPAPNTSIIQYFSPSIHARPGRWEKRHPWRETTPRRSVSDRNTIGRVLLFRCFVVRENYAAHKDIGRLRRQHTTGHSSRYTQ